MKNSKQKTPKSGGSARAGARRGSVYDQIAQAREKRQEVLSGRSADSADPAISGAVAALRGKDAPDPKASTQPKSFAEAPAPEVEVVENETASAADEPAAPTSPERSLEETVAAEMATSEPKRGTGPLWLVSITLAALAVGSVAWFSRPAGQSATPTVVASPAPSDVADTSTAPTVFAGGLDPIASPDAGAALELALAASGWSGVRVVTPGALAAPMPDPTLAAVVPSNLPRPPERPASIATAAPETPADTFGEEDVVTASDAVAEAPETPVPTPIPSEVLEEAVAETAIDDAAPVSSTLDDIRVVLNAPRTVPDASLAAVISALEDSGANADPRRVNLTISTSNVRYYHAEDAEAAAAIADGIGARLRDFTDFEPQPPEGLVEIWMAGREIAAATREESGPLEQLAQDLRRLEQELRRALGGN